MTTLKRALLLGFAFGIAAATCDIWLGLTQFVMRRMGGGPLFFVKVAFLEVAIATGIGLLLAPLVRVSAWLHAIALCGAWYGLQRWVALDSPMFAMQMNASAAGAVVVFGLGALLARWRKRAPWIAVCVLVPLGLAAPSVYLSATAPPAPPAPELPPARAGAPDIVLIVLDTVRAENVSTYGYSRATAPNITALAKESAIFHDATSPSTWSLPSHSSLFTGRYPSSHGAHAENQYLDGRYPTLAQVLQGNGYETFCITANAWISDGLGLTRGFGWQDESLRNEGGAGLGFSFVHRILDRVGLLEADKGGDAVATSFENWAAERPADAERPAFVFLNFIEAHFPYHQLPHDYLWKYTDVGYSRLREISTALLGAQFGGSVPPAQEVAQPTIDMYDGGVLYTDMLLGRVVETQRARGRLDETVFVVLADHGEVLGEFGDFFGHGPSLYQPSVGVPLLIRYPARVPPGTRIDTPVSTLGVFATILDLANITPPPTLQVGSLAPLIRRETGASGGPILSEIHDNSFLGAERARDDPQMRSGRRYRLLRDGDLKLIVTSKGETLLYDLAADPEESRDLSAERPDDLGRMIAILETTKSALSLPDIGAELAVGENAPELDAATQERLRALGYAP
jgi:arylsulfatase A-like enzyme